ncbi:cyanoexosortase B [Okeania sp.]|uniref:cyanoexosortase B n=1 Tax=Okeania sp. TaxID=3100323 RepID=UPI002B4AFEF4|nr:cyanoexosortase B [Okeania sp.]MEB3343538.1 cyanoexosortase B [Okeania sp.]
MQTRQKIPIAIEENLLTIAITALIFLMYIPLIIYWYDGWINKSISIEHEYFSHGAIGLPFAGYIVWNNRQKWQNLPNTSHPVGGVLLGIAGVWYLSDIPDLIDLSFPLMLTGICLWFKGIPGFKLMGMALLLIWLASPNNIPYLIEPYILPLQKFIAAIIGFILNQFNMNIDVNGIYLDLDLERRVIEIAPHCAGLKMLFTSLYVSLVLLNWTGAIASRGKTICLLFSAVLINVSGNIIRNALLTIFYGTGQDEAFHWFHESWGGDMYSICMLSLLFPIMNLIDDYFTNSVDFPNQPE